MTSCEGTGKNIEQAIENALLELRAAREDCDIKILNEGGFLKKAKVLVTISQDALAKYEKKTERRKSILEEENDDDFAENFMKKKAELSGGEQKQEDVLKQQKKAEKEEAKTEKKAEKAEEKVEKKAKVFADEEISDNENRAVPAKAEKTERKLTGEEFLKGVLKTLDLDGEVEKTVDGRFERYSLTGKDLNDLIGHHGECMLALSQIMNSVCKTEEHRRIVLDVEGYRAKREESLTALAHRIANKVAKSGRYFKLEPMDASERKIIHTALQEDDRVTTLSKGEEPRRYLIVFPKEYND